MTKSLCLATLMLAGCVTSLEDGAADDAEELGVVDEALINCAPDDVDCTGYPTPPARKRGEAAAGDPLVGEDWPTLVGRLAVTGAARELARHAALKRSDGRTYELMVPKAKASLAERAYQDKLKAALEAHLGHPVVIKVSVGDDKGASVAVRENQAREARQADATRAVQQDQFVQSLVEIFDGKVVESTIRAASDNGK